MYWMAFNTSLQAKFEYRVDFILGVVTSCMLQLAALGMLWIVLNQTKDLNGWSPGTAPVIVWGDGGRAGHLRAFLQPHLDASLLRGHGGTGPA